MKSPRWLLETEVFQEDSKPFVEALQKLGVEHQVIQFGKSYEDYIPDFTGAFPVVFHGSFQAAFEFRRKANWIPGVYCNLPEFECLYYYPRFGRHLANSEYVMLPFGELNRRKDWLLKNVGQDSKIFLRPSSGFKTFTGKIVSVNTWDKDIKLLGFYDVDPEALVVACPPLEIEREWRTVVVENKIVAASQYKLGEDNTRKQDVPAEVLKYGQDVLDSIKYAPDPAWTLDICETPNGLKVLETGSFSCAGLYACEPEPIIQAVNEVAIKDWKDA